jgi:hypothetical protein
MNNIILTLWTHLLEPDNNWDQIHIWPMIKKMNLLNNRGHGPKSKKAEMLDRPI